mgnify:CR=1 FL=1
MFLLKLELAKIMHYNEFTQAKGAIIKVSSSKTTATSLFLLNLWTTVILDF